MKKTFLLAALLLSAVAIGLSFRGNRHNGPQLTEEVAAVPTELETNEYVSATVTLKPTFGTNIAKPGQFTDPRTN
jgi:hypothetical protein